MKKMQNSVLREKKVWQEKDPSFIQSASDWIKKKYVEEDIFDDKKDLKYTFKEHIDKKKDCCIKEEYVEEDFKDIIDEHDVDD